MRRGTSACAGWLALLVCLGVGAEAGLGKLFHGEPESSYKLMADYLFKVEPTNELGANTKAAAGVLGEQPKTSAELNKLVDAFGALKGADEDKEVFCSRSNLANLRTAAESMQREGNLGPKDATDPIRRLNSIIISVVADAWSGCLKHLEGKWKSYRSSLSSDYSVVVKDLRRLPRGFTYTRDMGKSSDFLGQNFGDVLESVLEKVVRFRNFMGQDSGPPATKDKAVLEGQLENILEKSCRRFLASEAADSIALSARYLDLLVSYLMISPHMMREFYSDKRVRFDDYTRHNKVTPDNNYLVTQWAENYGACEALVATPRERLVKRIIEARKRADRPRYVPPSGRDDSEMGGCGLGFMFLAAGG